MKILAHPAVFTILLIAAVGSLVATSWAFASGADWATRWRFIGPTLLLWVAWTLSCRAMTRASLGGQGGALSPPDAALVRYNSLQGVWAAGFVASVFFAAPLFGGQPEPLHWLAPALPAAILVLWAASFIRMFRAADEMQQVSLTRAVALAGGGVVFAASVWGLFERAGAPALPAFLLLPIFSGVYGAVLSFQWMRQR